MSATKVLDMAEKQGLLEAGVIADLRKQVAESKFVVTAEAIAKVLVDHGHLTAFQARKLVSTALGEPEIAAPSRPAPDRPAKPAPAAKPHESELGLADSSSHDDIVEMQVAAPPKPPAAKPPPPKKSSRSHAETRPLDVPPSRPAPPRSPSPLVPIGAPASKPPPALEPISAPRPASPLTPIGAPAAAPVSAGAALQPLPSAPALQPLDLTADPLHAPAGPLTPTEERKTRKVAQPKKNPWSSPTFLLLGFGLLFSMAVAFFLLYYALFRTPIAELFNKAGEDYDAGSLGAAKEKYEEYLSRHGEEGDDASLARVRLGMIDLRQASNEGKSPKPGVEAANRILPDLLKEKRFSDARFELRGVLVTMAASAARSAHAAKETVKKQELVTLTESALELVDNASYIPSSMRGEVQSQINETLDVLKSARRSIDQDNDLVKALDEMQQAIEAKDASAAYQIRANLLKTYPALEANPKLIETTTAVAAMEQAQVKLREEPIAPAMDDEPRAASSLALAHASGGDSGLAGQYFVTLVHGSLFGLDAKEGKVLWRRYVGHDAPHWPIAVSSDPGADVLAVDPLKYELLRLSAATGKPVWRLPIGEPFATPAVGAEQAYVTTQGGRILEVQLADGQSARHAQLTQQPTVSPTVDVRRQKLYQIGRHSTLFVLDATRLACTETYYLGHKAGSIFVPPAVALEHVFVAESPGDDFTLIHALGPSGESKKLAPVAKPIRLKGRVVVPMQVDRFRVVAVTDAGQVAVFQVDTGNKEQPVRLLASGEPAGSPAVLSYFAMSPGQIFLTSQGVATLEVQAASQRLGSIRQQHGTDVFVAPPQVIGKTLLHVRRPKGSLATVVEAWNTETNRSMWKTEITAPLAALTYNDARQELVAINSRGRVYEIPAGELVEGILDKPAYAPLPGTESMSLTDVVELGSGRLALIGPEAGEHSLIYDPAAAPNRVSQFRLQMDASAPTAPAVFFQGGLAVPQSTGQMLLVDPQTGGAKAQPFQPPLQAGQRIPWNRPAVIGPDGTMLAASDGRVTVYSLALRPQPQPHLALQSETVLDWDVVAPLATSSDGVMAVVRETASDIVIALAGNELGVAGKTPLAGRVQFGPVSAGGKVFVADEKNLYALDAGAKIAWSQPLAHGQPALAPLNADGDLVVVTRDGAICRLAADSGQELAVSQLGQAAGRLAVIVGDKIVVAGPDGALLTTGLPARP